MLTDSKNIPPVVIGVVGTSTRLWVSGVAELPGVKVRVGSDGGLLFAPAVTVTVAVTVTKSVIVTTGC